jgi:GDP/UDP-N,N'-diacetylbacillosamine 2-epimerase (hydrolysing)
MRIGVLTSSRADFGIYLPLLIKLKEDQYFDISIIAFGTHLSAAHGKTVDQILEAGFSVEYEVESLLLTDSVNAISSSIGLTTLKFADFWKNFSHKFDLVFCIGDRYEMFAAVTAGISFRVQFAHIHGGERTLGAIDNIFRHAITLSSAYHFVSTAAYAERVAGLIESEDNIHYVGALSLDNLNRMSLLSLEEFQDKWGVDMSKRTILTTFHPETVAPEKNAKYTEELIRAINALPEFQVLITMPNADAEGNVVRQLLNAAFQSSERVFLIENLGSQSYFSAMNLCSFLLGNTSSGIIEAASFRKYVIDLGDRQKGRMAGENVIHIPVETSKIIEAVKEIEYSSALYGENIYYKGGASNAIIKVLKEISFND